MLPLPLLQGTPDTVNYLIAGYVFLIGLPVLYVLSWFVRRRSLERDLETIESLKQDEQQRAAKPAPAAADLSATADKPGAP
jgi:hypothetical protein